MIRFGHIVSITHFKNTDICKYVVLPGKLSLEKTIFIRLIFDVSGKLVRQVRIVVYFWYNGIMPTDRMPTGQMPTN
jgi:hypothetical protein